jgi:hypothetical protein
MKKFVKLTSDYVFLSPDQVPKRFRSYPAIFTSLFRGHSISLFVSSLFENSAAPSPQRAIEQVPIPVQVSNDILSEFISSLFASSWFQVSIGHVKFYTDDAVPSSSPKLFPGMTPECRERCGSWSRECWWVCVCF